MFCKNCGNAINEADERCDVCQFKVGFGKNYCQFCGKKLEEGENVCSDCGNEASVSSNTGNEVIQAVDKKNDPATYKKKFMKLNIFSLCVEVASLLLIACLIFLPIYKCKYEAQLEDIEDFDQLEEALENDGYLEKSFSAFGDFMILIDELLAESDSEDGMLKKFIVIENGLFLFFEIIFAVVLMFIIAKKVLENINSIRNIDNNCILRYNEIKKSGRQESKQGFFQKQSVFSILSYAAFDIIFTKFLFELLSFGTDFVIGRNMNNIVGVSGFIAVVIVLLAAQIVTKSLYKKEEDSIRLQIAKEE